MGTSESTCRSIGPSCCTAAPPVRVQKVGSVQACHEEGSLEGSLAMGRTASTAYGCTNFSHVESLLAHLPPDVHAALEDEAFQTRCHETFCDIQKSSGTAGSEGFLEGDQLIDAVHRAVPDKFLNDRLHETNLAKLLLSFDLDGDGRISEEEFDLFCMWAVAMEVMGFFAGTTPFAKIADVIGDPSSTKLLIVSEFLDPDHILEKCSLPSTLCAYYHPDGLTLDELSTQIESAAHVRASSGKKFQSVALANHGPDEDGLWNVCSDHPVSLHSTDKAWPRLMPFFRALAAMVEDPGQTGCVDLFACDFAATTAGRACIQMISQHVNARFSASTDATGNAAQGGNWVLESPVDRNVAPVYFHEEKLHTFTDVMGAGAIGRKTVLKNGKSFEFTGNAPRRSTFFTEFGQSTRPSTNSRKSGPGRSSAASTMDDQPQPGRSSASQEKAPHHMPHMNSLMKEDVTRASRVRAEAELKRKPPARKKKMGPTVSEGMV